MALCLAGSLVEAQGFDARDQGTLRSLARTRYLSSKAGASTSAAGQPGADALREDRRPMAGSARLDSAGKGCIMRWRRCDVVLPGLEAMVQHSAESSKDDPRRHGVRRRLPLMAGILFRAFEGAPKEAVLFGDPAFTGAPKIEAIARAPTATARRPIAAPATSSTAWEAALWCVWTTETFEARCCAGEPRRGRGHDGGGVRQVAGALYGVEASPRRGAEKVAMAAFITELADRLNRGRAPGVRRRPWRLSTRLAPVSARRP